MGVGACFVLDCARTPPQLTLLASAQEGASIQMTKSMVSYNQGAALAIDQGASAKVENNDLRNNVQGPCLVGVASQHLVSVTNNLTTA